MMMMMMMMMMTLFLLSIMKSVSQWYNIPALTSIIRCTSSVLMTLLEGTSMDDGSRFRTSGPIGPTNWICNIM